MIREDPDTLTMLRQFHDMPRSNGPEIGWPATVDAINTLTRRSWTTWHGELLTPAVPAPTEHAPQWRRFDLERIADELQGIQRERR